jgi:hypothetical protein
MHPKLQSRALPHACSREIKSLTKNGGQTCRLNLLGHASGVVVDLATALATLVRPGEVSNRDDEERVAAVGNTGQSVVPGGKSSEHTESTTSSKAGNVSVLKVADS